MRMFLKSISILVLVSLLIGGLVGCDMLGGTTEDTGSDGGGTTTNLTPYSAVDFSDLGNVTLPSDETAEAIDGQIQETMASALDGLSMVFEGLDLLEDETHDATFVPKSITGTVAFSVEDEHFSIEEDLGTTTETWLDLNIKHLDLVLSGGIHSLTALIDSLVNDPEDTAAMFPANGQIGLSFNADIVGRIDDDDDGDGDITLKNSQSGYLSAALTNLGSDTQGNISGTLNAKLSYSAAMNYFSSTTNSNTTYRDVPILFTITMKDISNASLATLNSALAALDENSSEEDMWNAIKTSLWGNTDERCLVFKATFKDKDGVVQNLGQLVDEYAFRHLSQMLS
ncbi:hypothetical protein [uncultured Sphaerochaeta sp.]|uniref:hypothetical protein n=1 Tax=uncultured Sphaerochaeta sp. TaxID=886478 RepID=UPI0029CA851A|nr:hypothetical protein [uncultured Sphaerochaeta sp.]